MKTTLRINTKQASLELQRIASKDIPYALAQGLNRVAKAARDQVKQELPSIFHNTNAFTRNAVAFTPANKNHQTATIFIKDQQAKYLQFEEYGGTRTSTDNLANPSAKAFSSGNCIGDQTLLEVKATANADDVTISNFTVDGQTFKCLITGGTMCNDVCLHFMAITSGGETRTFNAVLPIRSEGALNIQSDGTVFIMGNTGAQGRPGEKATIEVGRLLQET